MSDALRGIVRTLSIAHRTKEGEERERERGASQKDQNSQSSIHSILRGAPDSLRRSSRVASEFAGRTEDAGECQRNAERRERERERRTNESPSVPKDGRNGRMDEVGDAKFLEKEEENRRMGRQNK